MEYKGKKSRVAYGPCCSYARGAGDFCNTCVFISKADAESLIEQWVFNVTKHNPDAFLVSKAPYGTIVYNKSDERMLYSFHIDVMNLFD